MPLKVIGRMVLNRWPDNFFAETEQVAFCPANIVPGLDFSDDPLLQGRLFSYLDTQLTRLGGSNSHLLPIKAPKCPFANTQRDGHMQMAVPKEQVNYEPSSLQGNSPREAAAGFRSFGAAAGKGGKGRVRVASFADHYSQARLFIRNQSEREQAHIAAALVFELSKVQTARVRESVVGHLRHVDTELAKRVATGLGIDPLPPAAATKVTPKDMATSPALQIIGKMKPTLEGRCIGILVDDGSDELIVAALRAAAEADGAAVKLVAPRIGGVKSKAGKMFAVAGQLAGTPSVVFDAVALVLTAAAAAQALAKEVGAVDWVRDAFGHLKAIAFDTGARAVLTSAGVQPDAGNAKAFIKAARTRQFARESQLRTLA